ncbi:MAG TPA: acetyl-CoA carboxylase biotin carboxyl carrier protein [Solirubrobacteraceae bacterium]|nr:acetyl-CoA carboxylase biotin carboxyl carrier protein [Solirubrobacteraceae bacterium]
MPLSDDDVREILRIIDESDLSELRIDTDGFSLHVVKGDGGALASPPPPRQSHETKPESEPEPAPDSPGSTDGLTTIPAPMLGTFYRAEAPGKPPFVEVGSRVEPDTIVCIIEVMKMMNSVPAGVAGTVAEVIAENAHLVEYGEPLFRVEPETA